MRKTLTSLLTLLFGTWALWGCGSAGGGNEFQAGERLTVVKVLPKEGDTFVVNVLKQTDDSGIDGVAKTSDPGENDGLPDEGEAVVSNTEPKDVAAVLTLENQPRAGVSPGVDLLVKTIDVTYLDRDGNARFETNRQFPTGTLQIKPGSTGEVTIVLMPLSTIKMQQPKGPETIFRTKDGTFIDPIRQLTAVLDIYAVDALDSDNQVHVQTSVSVTLQNPMEL